jgi:hypothetical protein
MSPVGFEPTISAGSLFPVRTRNGKMSMKLLFLTKAEEYLEQMRD